MLVAIQNLEQKTLKLTGFTSEQGNFPHCYPITYLYVAFLHARLDK